MDTRSRIVPTDNEALPQAPLALHAVDAFRALDQTKEAAIARLTGGLSPAALSLAVADWLIHLSSAPGKRLQLQLSLSRTPGKSVTTCFAARWAARRP